MNVQEKILEGWDASASVGVRQEEDVSLRWDQLRYDRRFHAAPSERLQSPIHCPQPTPAAYPWEKPKSGRSDPSVDDTKAFQKHFSLAVCFIAIPMLFALCAAVLFLGAGIPLLWLPLILLCILVSYLGHLCSS
jgi:hypothetical protein